jgi:DNA topoisomerase-3
MKFIQAKPSRLHCSNCDDTFTLPQNGNIKLYKELKCPLDDYELVLWTTGVKGKVMLYISKSGNNFLIYFRLKVEI